MATLLNGYNNEKIELMAQHIIGRHPSSANIVIGNPKASRIHATVGWDGEQWSIKDSSTNGTFVNNQRLAHNQEQVLVIGDKIDFIYIDQHSYMVGSLEPPKSMLIPETPGTPLIVLENLVVLPDEQSPEITLYRNTDGFWLCEGANGTNVLVNGTRIGVLNNTWRFIEASGCAATVGAQGHSPDDNIEVHFKVSQNEEHVTLSCKVGAQLFDLGERNHHYLLLLLARARLNDKAENLAEKEQG
ncbi:MAG: FHA domain-containing protein, partial [Algicola sp.]|nr:FHA domain-containing protein [Algicola sp.]